MKGPIKSALSVALAMAASQAFALGLGQIQIKSGLNQPLLAEIPVVTDSAAEAEDLRVALASADDFQRVGLSRARVTVPLEFAVVNSARGQTMIRLTTKEAVREPFLDFLIEASWSKGKVLREYTVLLDPPVTAPAVLTSTPKAVEKPKSVEAAPRAPTSQSRVSEPKPVVSSPPPAAPAPRPAPTVAPPTPTSAAAPTARASEYTVQRGDTLSQIAHEFSDDQHDFNRMLLALYRANPKAFAGNMNALKSGSVLRIPAPEDVRAIGSLREAAAEVNAQYQTWQNGSAATLVANAGATAATEKPISPGASGKVPSSEHVALVPPSDSGNAAATSHGGTGNDTTTLRADLARTKETLSTREQEASDLKSRVGQLEDMNAKSQRLISLKDSEIAELQNKLKQLDASRSGAAPAEKTATTPASVAAPPAAPAATPPSSTAAPAAPAAPSATAPAPVSTPTAAPSASAPPPAVAPANPSPVAATPKPAATAAAKPTVPTTTAKPWYAEYIGDNAYLLYGGGGLLALIAAWLLARAFGGKKANPRPQRGLAVGVDDEDAQAQVEREAEDYYAKVPSEHVAHDHADASTPDVDDEFEQLHQHFDDADAEGFLTVAHALHEKLPEDSSEWHEVAELGRKLLPGNPLFGLSAFTQSDHEPYVEHAGDDVHAFAMDVPAHAESNDYDAQLKALADHDEPLEFEPHHMQADEKDAVADLEFEREFDKHLDADPVADDAVEGKTLHRVNALDEDTVGTRLDLARAYFDMGDPEGARLMLDEVLAEGNAEQREEARKLLAEIG